MKSMLKQLSQQKFYVTIVKYKFQIFLVSYPFLYQRSISIILSTNIVTNNHLLDLLFGENELLRGNPDNFFSHPFEEYGKDLEKLKINHPLKYCSLALLIMFGKIITFSSSF
jgi:hypothetical protein